MVPVDNTHHPSETVGSITQAATLACDGQKQNVEERLKKLLLEQTQENDRLVQALHARGTERWQLSQLLQHKDEQLQAARESSLQTKVSFQPAQKTVSRYLALCVFHAWLDITRRNQGRRRLLQAKNKFAAVVVRRACKHLCANLQRATNRQTRNALHGLWLHAAGEHVGGRVLKREKTCLVEEAIQARFSFGDGKTLLSPQTEDMLFATPRGGAAGCFHASSHGPPRGCPSPTSDASTSVPPSSSPFAAGATDISKASRHWMGYNTASVAAARLASTVEASHEHSLSWAMRNLHAGHISCPFPLPPIPPLPDESRSTCYNADDANARQSRKVELLEMCYSQECDAFLEERERKQDLQVEIHVLQELAERGVVEAEAAEEVLEAESRKLKNAEVLQATLESRLAQEANWRSEAEHRIINMVSCGEALEHERAQLLILQAELQEAEQVARRALELEEQANESMRLRTRAFEEENSRLIAHSRHERQTRLKQASSQESAIALARRDVVSLHTANDGVLQKRTRMIAEEPYKVEAAATHAFCEAWDNEREDAKRNHDRIRAHTKMLCEESGAVRWGEQVEAQIAATSQEHALKVSNVWQEHHRVQHAACAHAQLEAETEMEACELTKATLEECFARVTNLQEELTSAEKSRSPAISSHQITGSAEYATAQLDELDSYAQLVARLHAEIRWERAEREAADSSLSSLRSSYRLLLERVDCQDVV